MVSDELSHYDLVVFDLPGKPDNIAINGLVAAGSVVAPVKPGAFERNQLAPIRTNLADIRDQDLADVGLPRGLTLEQVVVTMYQTNRKRQEEFVEHVRDEYAGLAAPSVVPSTEDILHAQADGCTLFAREDDELYSTGLRARDAYQDITEDILSRLDDQ